MPTKASQLMKVAQTEKTKQTVERLIEWYAKKQEFFKTYFPIQQSLIKRIIGSSQITMERLKQICQIVAEEKEVQATIFEKCQKNLLKQQSRFLPKSIDKIDPNDPKGQSRIKVQQPVWCHNIDRILISMSKNQKQRQSKVKQIYKTLDGIQQVLSKEQSRYKSEIKKQEKQIDNLFNSLDQSEKEQSKIVGKLVKEGKGNQIKDSAFFIGELKKIEKEILNQFSAFAKRGKQAIELIQLILKNEKAVSKKIKEQLTTFFKFKKQVIGIQSKGEQQILGYLSLAEDKIQAERQKYYSAALLTDERIHVLKKLMAGSQLKNNWQVIASFLESPQQYFMEAIKTKQSLSLLLKTISYRCWQGIYLAQGWLIQSYAGSVMYMTYDYIMLIYSVEGVLLKKILTNSSKVNKVQGNTVFLQEKVKGFFTDSIEEYKIRFDDTERMEEFQLFIENQIV